MKGLEFLRQKYTDLGQSHEVESVARRTKIRTGKELPQKSAQDMEARIQNYLDRLKEIIDSENKEEREHGINVLKRSLHIQFVIKSKEIPESYFDSIKRKHKQEGHGDIEIPADYRRELSETLISDQKRSLDNWVDYLASDEAKYPDWLKYYTIRNVLKMGRYDKTKRAEGYPKSWTHCSL